MHSHREVEFIPFWAMSIIFGGCQTEWSKPCWKHLPAPVCPSPFAPGCYSKNVFQLKNCKARSEPYTNTKLQGEEKPQKGSRRPLLFVPDSQGMEHGSCQGAGNLLQHKPYAKLSLANCLAFPQQALYTVTPSPTAQAVSFYLLWTEEGEGEK